MKIYGYRPCEMLPTMMHHIHKPVISSCLGMVVLFLMVTVLGGCVLNKAAVKPEAKAETAKTDDAKTAGAPLLDEGLDGFIINEVVQMSSDARSAFERAVAMLNEAQYEAAIAVLEQVIEQSPGVTAPYINLGMAYQYSDKKEKAEAQYKRALEILPGHPVANNQYGLLCRKAGRFDEARTLYEQALAAYPNYYPAHRNLGILCDLYLNDLESALAHYEIYYQAMPEDGEVKLWIADLKGRMGVN